MRKTSITGFIVMVMGFGSGCAGALVEPGHRALLFDPTNGGIQHEVLQPGWYRMSCPFWMATNKCPHVDDFDVTYSTAKENVHTLSMEGLPLDLHIAVVYRPIVSELYLLDTDIGMNYFDEVIGPEFRSAAIGVFARTSYQDLQKKNGAIEDEVEKELRQRLRGRHVEISSVLIEKVNYDPRIMESLQARVVTQEQTLAQKQQDDNRAAIEKHQVELQTEAVTTRAAHKKVELAAQTEQKKLELEADAEQKKLAAIAELDVKKIQIQKQTDEDKFLIDSQLRNKKAERQLTVEQAQIDQLKANAEASTKVVLAKGEAASRLALAHAEAAEVAAKAADITTNQVMMHAYDALGKLGGSGTSFMLGDWSKLPQWLFPRVPAFQNAFGTMYPYPGVFQPAGEGSKVSSNP
jgi:regulator of protease activity HflC (stomatin/prohibitin superfamily)